MNIDNVKVKVDYKNENLDIVDTEQYDIDLYCQKLSDDVIKVLSDIEGLFLSKEIPIDSSNFYRQLKHKIFDVAGSIKRLPNNMIEIQPKATKKSVLSFLGKGDE
jgi:hypothetical protein